MNKKIERQLQTRKGLIELLEATHLLHQCIFYSKEEKFEPLFADAFDLLLVKIDKGKYGFEQAYANIDLEKIFTFEQLHDAQISKALLDVVALKSVIETFEHQDDSSLLKRVVSLKDNVKFTNMMIRMSDQNWEDREQLLEIAQCEELGFLRYYDIQNILCTRSLSDPLKVALSLNWVHDQKNSNYCAELRKEYFEKGKKLHLPLMDYLYHLSGNISEQSQKNYDLRTVVENHLIDLNDYPDEESIFAKYYRYALSHYDQYGSWHRKLFEDALPAILSTGNGIRPGDEKLVIETLMEKGRTKEICEFFALDQYRHFDFDTADFLFEQLPATYCDYRSSVEKFFLSTLIEQWIELEEHPDENQALLYLIEKSCENSPLYESRQKLHDTLQTIVEPLNSVMIGSYYSGQNKDTEAKKPYVKRVGNVPYSRR